MSEHENGKRFNKAEYLRKKAEHDQQRPTFWITNPETGSEFEIRFVGAVGYAIQGALPHNLPNEAVNAWETAGIDTKKAPVVPGIDRAKLAAAERNLDLIAMVLRDACVTPKVVSGAKGDDEIDPLDMLDSDILYIFRRASGQIGAVPLKGGEEVAIPELQTFSERPAGNAGARAGSPELQPAAE